MGSSLQSPDSLEGFTSEQSPLSASFFRHEDLSDSTFDLHYEVELGFVLEGEMTRIWEDGSDSSSYERTLGPGQAWLCGIWEAHGFRILRSPCSGIVFFVRPEFLIRAGESLETGIEEQDVFYSRDLLAPFMLPPSSRPSIDPENAARLVDFFRNYQPDKDGFRDALMLNVLIDAIFENGLAAALDGGKSPIPRSRARRGSSRQFRDILPAIDMGLRAHDPITTRIAAAACGMSESTFERRFSALMGMGFARFCLNHRLKESALRLSGTDMGIKEIADEWGFSDLSHFYRSFNQAFRITPAQYRERFGR